MKRILTILFVIVLLFGCTATSQCIMVQNEDGKYGLLELKGKTEPEFLYDSYITGVDGCIVEKNGNYALISRTGKETIPFKTYQKIESIGNLLIGYDTKGKITVLDVEGKVLYTESKNSKIIISGLPIIKQEKKYSVLNTDGTTVISTQDKVIYAELLNDTTVLIGYQNKMSIYDTIKNESKDIKGKGTYTLAHSDENIGYLLYDEEEHTIVYITAEYKKGFTLTKEIDSLSFDKNENIVASFEGEKSIISKDGETVQKVDSYYKNETTYVIKHTDKIYGPHLFYFEGNEYEVEGIQIDPNASYIKHDIFPVYVKEKGYQYYNFKGEAVFKTKYRDATPFDHYEVAIVSQDAKEYYLITMENKKISEVYQKIESLGKGYYAGYLTDNRYEILNAEGKVIIDTYFIGNKEVFTYQGTAYGIFSKNGKSYVYQIKSNTLLFEVEGEVEYFDAGYFIVNEKAYYSMKGEEIYSR